MGKPAWEFFAFCTGLSIPYQTMSFFLHTPHTFCFVLTPMWLLVCRLVCHRRLPKVVLAFSKGDKLPHPSAHSRRWLSAPSPTFPELPRSLSLSPWECWDGCATSTSWRLQAKLREGRVISRHHPSHDICSATPAMPNICISHRQTGLHHFSILLRTFLITWNVQLH